MRTAVVLVSLAGVFGAVSLGAPREAQAQTVNEVSPTGKGIAGCALLGGEAVMLIEAAAGARPTWAYIVGGGLGAVGGGVAGYFLEQAAEGDSTLTGLSVGTLVVGLGLVIPTTIAALSATAYNPEHDQPVEDNAPATGPLDESTTPASTTPAATPSPATTPAPATGSGSGATSGTTSDTLPIRRRSRQVAARPAFRPTGLFDVTPSGFSFAVPAINVGNNISAQEVRQYGLTPVSELRVPLLSGTF
jgi:predicted lipid-binding transport protein (Tim44 family)